MIFGVFTPLVHLSPAEVHADLSLLGVSSEVHNLVDDLELVPLVLDEEKKRRIINKCCLNYSSDLVLSSYVRKPYHSEKEETGRLF